MALPSDSTTFDHWLRSLEPWVWPMTAAILVSGGLVLCSLSSLLWLATHPAPTTVVWMMPPAVMEKPDSHAATAIQSSGTGETMP
jgi:hypothetical protein